MPGLRGFCSSKFARGLRPASSFFDMPLGRGRPQWEWNRGGWLSTTLSTSLLNQGPVVSFITFDCLLHFQTIFWRETVTNPHNLDVPAFCSLFNFQVIQWGFLLRHHSCSSASSVIPYAVKCVYPRWLVQLAFSFFIFHREDVLFRNKSVIGTYDYSLKSFKQRSVPLVVTKSFKISQTIACYFFEVKLESNFTQE